MNQKGFSQIIIFVVLGVIIIGSAGYFTLVNKSANNSTSPSVEISTEASCKHPNKKVITKEKEPEFVGSDCQFSASEKIEITGLDLTSCKRISKYFIVDNNYVYKQLYDPGSSDYNQYVILKEAAAKSFKPVKDNYYRDSFNFFYDIGAGYKIVRNVDSKSLKVLSTHYLKDKNYIYFSQLDRQDQVIKVPGFDVETFKVIQNEQNHEQYFSDKNGVYFSEELGGLNVSNSKINLADINTFEVLDYYLMAKDENYVYYEGKIIEGADSKTFEVLGTGYFKDNTNVYTQIGGFRKLPGVDGCSFELINYVDQYQWERYSKDRNKVYYQDLVVEDADPATFKIENGKAFDKNYEFRGAYKVQN